MATQRKKPATTTKKTVKKGTELTASERFAREERIKLPELSPTARALLDNNTSTRHLVRAALDGPRALLDELNHAWVTTPEWLVLALSLIENPEPPAEAAPTKEHNVPAYAVWETRAAIPFKETETCDDERLRKIATDIVAGMQVQDIHPHVREFLFTYSDITTRGFVEAVSGKFARLIPITYLLPTGLPNIAMLNRISFEYNEQSRQVILTWAAFPIVKKRGERGFFDELMAGEPTKVDVES
jgi:hypothetical protein